MGKKDVFHGWNCLLFYLELVWFIKLSMSKLEKNSNLVIILGLIPFFTIMEKFVTESNFMQFLKTMGNYFSEPILKLRIFWPISQIFIAFFFVKNDVISWKFRSHSFGICLRSIKLRMNLWGHRFSQNTNQKLTIFLPYPLINFQGRNLGNFWLAFWGKRWPNKFILNLIDLYWIQWVKFMYSEKATKCCKMSTKDLIDS